MATDKPTDNSAGETEVESQEDIGETLEYLENIIEKHAESVEQLKAEMKEKRQSLRNVFENDTELAEAKEQADQYKQQVRDRKSAIKDSPQVKQLKTTLSELRQERKEIEETLSNHLLNYYNLTNSTSFDTSDGGEWEFKIKAKVKSRRK